MFYRKNSGLNGKSWFGFSMIWLTSVFIGLMAYLPEVSMLYWVQQWPNFKKELMDILWQENPNISCVYSIAAAQSKVGCIGFSSYLIFQNTFRLLWGGRFSSSSCATFYLLHCSALLAGRLDRVSRKKCCFTNRRLTGFLIFLMQAQNIQSCLKTVSRLKSYILMHHPVRQELRDRFELTKCELKSTKFRLKRYSEFI